MTHDTDQIDHLRERTSWLILGVGLGMYLAGIVTVLVTL